MTKNDYKFPLRDWDEMSWIRSGEFREGTLEGPMFSAQLTPLVEHSAIRSRPDHVRKLLAYRLLTHLHFTTVLELDHVNPICAGLAQGRYQSLVHLGLDQRNDALKIYCDEGAHALFVETLMRAVEAHHQVDRVVVGVPRFDAQIKGFVSSSGIHKEILQLLFVSVSETLVSKILRAVPQDQTVNLVVREVIADHADDEARHSTYFQWLFPRLWAAVSPSQKDKASEVLAHFILSFLSPDTDSDLAVLQQLGHEKAASLEILEDTYSPQLVSAAIREAATPTLRMFEHAGVMESPRARDIFDGLGLQLDTADRVDSLKPASRSAA